MAAQTRPSLKQFFEARVVVFIVGAALIMFGKVLLQYSTGWGFEFVGWGGGILLTYLVVDILLLRQDRVNWSKVKKKVLAEIASTLRGVWTDVSFLTGAQEVAVSIPRSLTREQESALFAEAWLKEANRLAGNLAALGEKMNPSIEQSGDLFASRAESLASFQNRYWSRLLDPDLMGFLVDLEGKLRFVDTSLKVYEKYRTAAPPADKGLEPLRVYLIDDSHRALVESLLQLLKLVLTGIDAGFVPTA